MQLIIATAIAMLATVSAYCPNACSGHGTCVADPKDSCSCYNRKENQGFASASVVPDWAGADCSLRTCPSYIVEAGSPSANNEHFTVEECSGRGACDRKAGQCKCNPGYAGSACQMAVPDDGLCSGRGQLVSLRILASLYSCNNPQFGYQFNKHCYDQELYIGAMYEAAWDAEREFGCLCDSGFSGPACENVLCSSTTDVLGGEGAESARECSGRGKCDYKTGVCECYQGYKGESCESQSTFV